MTVAERLGRWNRQYDTVPSEWRFQFVLWPLLALGAINLALTIWIKFPFALLVVLGILFISAVRVPYTLGWVTSADRTDPAYDEVPTFQIAGARWIVDLNHRYDAMPEGRRFWIIPAVLLIAGAINMLLTIGRGFPFGLLFLLALLAVVAIRAPYTAGWFKTTPALGEPAGSMGLHPAEVEHKPMAAIASDAPPPEHIATPHEPHVTSDRIDEPE